MKINKKVILIIFVMMALPLQAAIQCNAEEWDSVRVALAADGSAKVNFVITPRLKIAEELSLPKDGFVYPYIMANLRFPAGACSSRKDIPTILECFTITPKNVELNFPREGVSRVLDSVQIAITHHKVETLRGPIDYHEVAWSFHDALTGKGIEESHRLECTKE